METKFRISAQLLAVFTSIILFASCGSGSSNNEKSDQANNEESIMVFAGASLTDVLSEIIDSFEIQYKVNVKTNMASSGTLARQIEQGATTDIYISASKKWADYVDSLGYIIDGYKKQVATNELVLIAPKTSNIQVNSIDSTLSLLALLGDNRISMGDPLHVPVGKYAKQSLEYFGWYQQLNAKILPAKDVRSALMVVEMEEAPIGIVYKTDALKSEKVKILNTFPEKSHMPIVFIAGLINENNVAKEFFAYLSSEEPRKIWAKYGFGI